MGARPRCLGTVADVTDEAHNSLQEAQLSAEKARI